MTLSQLLPAFTALVLTAACSSSPVASREIATPGAAAPLRTRIDLHRERIRTAEHAAPRLLRSKLYGQGVNTDVRANSTRPGRRDDVTLYNPATPETILIGGRETRVLAARSEKRGEEASSIWFFEVKRDGAQLRRIVDESIPALSAKSPLLKLQDPSVSIMDGDLYIGGVEVTLKDPKDPHSGLSYRHVIYRAPGRELANLDPKPVFVGEWGKKGTRFTRLPDGSLLVVSRPQGGVAGPGKIGWSIVRPEAGESFQQSLDRGIQSAKLFEGHVSEADWEGPNKLYVLKDGRVLFLSHQASFNGVEAIPGRERERTYVSTYFFLDPATGLSTKPEVILERADLPGQGSRGAKRPDLSDVVYTSGLETNPDGSIRVNRDGTLTLWFGEGDLLVGRAKIHNFLKG